MATENQIAANRRNAEKSTGPRTEEGKAHSSANSLKTGIFAKSEVISFENREDYEALIARLCAEFDPATQEEQSLLDAAIRYEWMSRRYAMAEAAAWEFRINPAREAHQGEIFLDRSKEITRANRLYQQARRGFQETLKQLKQIQTERRVQPAPEQKPAASAASIPKLGSFSLFSESSLDSRGETHLQAGDPPAANAGDAQTINNQGREFD
jgi:hypothetical protein